MSKNLRASDNSARFHQLACTGITRTYGDDPAKHLGPDKSQTVTFMEGTSSSFHFSNNAGYGWTGAGTITQAWFAKHPYGLSPFPYFYWYDSVAGAEQSFNFAAESVGNVRVGPVIDAGVEDWGNVIPGWKRYWVTYTGVASQGTMLQYNNLEVKDWTGDASGKGASMYCLQLYAGGLQDFENIDNLNMVATPLNLNSLFSNKTNVGNPITTVSDPLGGTLAGRLVETADNGAHYAWRANSRTLNSTLANPYTGSIFVKPGPGPKRLLKWIYGYQTATNRDIRSIWDIEAKKLVSVGFGASHDMLNFLTGGVEDVGGGWVRCWLRHTLPNDVANMFMVQMLNDLGQESYMGDVNAYFDLFCPLVTKGWYPIDVYHEGATPQVVYPGPRIGVTRLQLGG